MRRWIFVLAAVGVACEQPPPAKTAPATPERVGTPAEAPATVLTPAPTPTQPELPRAGEIAYAERLLGGATADETLPMIVAIHGLGDTPESFSHVFDTFPERARLILPQGVDVLEEGGFSWFPIRARDSDVEALSAGIAASADKLAVALAALPEDRPTVGAPILTGFSQGGMLTFAVAVRHPETIAAAFPIGGWLPPPLMPEAGPPEGAPTIEAFHGTDDRAMKFEPTKASVDGLTALGWNTELHVYEGVGHAITPELHRDLADLVVAAVQHAAG
jgi:phospholipase/carboxylesterase